MSTIQLLEIYTPELEAHVKYKVIDPADVDAFVEKNHHLPKSQFITLVMEMVVYNLKTEIAGILRRLEIDRAREIFHSVYNGCIMLNPGLDPDIWLKLSTIGVPKSQPVHEDSAFDPGEDWAGHWPDPKPQTAVSKSDKRRQKRLITRAKFLGLEPYLKEKLVGQDEAITSVCKAMKRSVAEISDPNRPIGVFLLVGPSGSGKTQLAKEIHEYLFGDKYKMVRIDCGEYQHKHENQKLLGAPPGYLGSDNGGHFTNQLAKNPYSVVLLDEVEKAHGDMWDTFLRVFDEGLITDGQGVTHSLRNCIIIMTSNLGNKEVIASLQESSVGFGGAIDMSLPNRALTSPQRSAVRSRVMKSVQKKFRPEFLNRIDEIVVFNHLGPDDFRHIAELQMERLSESLQRSGYQLNYSSAIVDRLVERGTNSTEGARGISKVLRSEVEDALSDALLSSTRRPQHGTLISLHYDGEYQVKFMRPSQGTTKAELASSQTEEL